MKLKCLNRTACPKNHKYLTSISDFLLLTNVLRIIGTIYNIYRTSKSALNTLKVHPAHILYTYLYDSHKPFYNSQRACCDCPIKVTLLTPCCSQNQIQSYCTLIPAPQWTQHVLVWGLMLCLWCLVNHNFAALSFNNVLSHKPKHRL